jgi:uncharacterized membrane protein YjjB (DUF3815 family)
MAVLFAAYLGQFVTNIVFGSYTSGFGGGLALMLFALAISLRPNTPPTAALLAAGFWLLVPGSIGLIGVTQLVCADSSAAITVTLVSMIAISLRSAPSARWPADRRTASELRILSVACKC